MARGVVIPTQKMRLNMSTERILFTDHFYPLEVAMIYGHTSMMTCLLEMIRDRYPSQYPDHVQAILNYSLCDYRRCEYSRSPVDRKERESRLAAVKLLVAHGGRPQDMDTTDPVVWDRFSHCQFPETLEFLLQNGFNPNSTIEWRIWKCQPRQVSLLETCMISCGNMLHTRSLILLLIKYGANVVREPSSDVEAFRRGSYLHGTFDPEIIAAFVAKGLDVNAVDSTGRTPIYYARHHGSAVSALLAHGASTDELCLIDQSVMNNLDLATKLLDRGDDPNQIDEWGRPPLYLAACIFHNTEIIKLLLDRGADINWRHQDTSHTCLHTLVVSLSSETYWTIDRPEERVRTLILECLYTKVIKLLINCGAQFLCNSRGQTPLMMMHRECHSDASRVWSRQVCQMFYQDEYSHLDETARSQCTPEEYLTKLYLANNLGEI